MPIARHIKPYIICIKQTNGTKSLKKSTYDTKFSGCVDACEYILFECFVIIFFFPNWLFFQNLVTFINWSCCVCCHKAWSWAIFVGFKLHPHTIFRGNNFPFPALCPSTKSFEFFWPAGDTIKNNNKIWAIWPLHGRYFQRKFPNGQIQSIRSINWLVVVIRAVALKSGATRLKSSFQLLN